MWLLYAASPICSATAAGRHAVAEVVVRSGSSSSSIHTRLGDGLRDVVKGVDLVVVEDDSPPLLLVQVLLLIGLSPARYKDSDSMCSRMSGRESSLKLQLLFAAL